MNKLDNLNSWKIFLSLANTRNFQVTADYFESDLSTITPGSTHDINKKSE